MGYGELVKREGATWRVEEKTCGRKACPLGVEQVHWEDSRKKCNLIPPTTQMEEKKPGSKSGLDYLEIRRRKKIYLRSIILCTLVDEGVAKRQK